MTANDAIRLYVDAYVPRSEQEARDREQILKMCGMAEDVFLRENTVAHFSASAWIVDGKRTKALMIYHNIYDTWAWTGGHADGEADLLAVAMREAMEETGVRTKAVSDRPISIESLCVPGHVKRGKYVSSHIHMNVTFLLEADPGAPVRTKPDENSGVMWVSFDEVCEKVTEPGMRAIYRKLMDRALEIR